MENTILARAQARVILIRLRKEVFDEWQRDLKRGENVKDNESFRGFIILTNAIRRV